MVRPYTRNVIPEFFQCADLQRKILRNAKSRPLIGVSGRQFYLIYSKLIVVQNAVGLALLLAGREKPGALILTKVMILFQNSPTSYIG